MWRRSGAGRYFRSEEAAVLATVFAETRAPSGHIEMEH
jgi:hypothetical protein